MNSKYLKYVGFIGVWAASSGLSYWMGSHNSPPPAKAAAGRPGKPSADYAPAISIGGNGRFSRTGCST